jgi:hypothetical protein
VFFGVNSYQDKSEAIISDGFRMGDSSAPLAAQKSRDLQAHLILLRRPCRFETWCGR